MTIHYGSDASAPPLSATSRLPPQPLRVAMTTALQLVSEGIRLLSALEFWGKPERKVPRKKAAAAVKMIMIIPTRLKMLQGLILLPFGE